MNASQGIGVEARPSTHIEGVIQYTSDLNTDLSNLVNRADTLCNRLGRGGYPKNHPVPINGCSPEKMPESDGLLEDLQVQGNRKASLINDLRTAIEYLEQHI